MNVTKLINLKRYRLRELRPDTKHIAKHLPDTLHSQKLLRKQGVIHVFKDEATMNRVAETIMSQGTYIGMVRGHERWAFKFDEPVGHRSDRNGNRLPLYWGEMKIKGGKYHVIPRTRPSNK
ncbi:MAG: hypothetical protein DRI57_00040 [Deltaproteobacteria bacterium]|nr:MAG: hypothetical protein DRI57_00040 [Deltaproteobacteria bacterium]